MLLLIFQRGYCQDLNKRHSFATSYFGIDAIVVPQLSNSAFLNQQGQEEVLTRSGYLTPAINIGATHFWGHADFFISISTIPISFTEDQLENNIRMGTMTGMRLYPWAIQNEGLRPYIGYRFAPFRLNQKNLLEENYRRTKVKGMGELGLAWQTGAKYIYLGYHRVFNPEEDIYICRRKTATSSYPDGFFTLGINLSLETTRGAYSPVIRELDTLLSNKNTLGLFIGVGPSAAFPTASSDYIQRDRPVLDDLSMPNIFPDFTIGYHFSKHDVAIAANFRPMVQERQAFGYEQRIRRNSIGVEAYKYLFDYHGFAPYLGIGYQANFIRFQEWINEDEVKDVTSNQSAYHLIFGWDIRPGKKGDYLLLRTNLRWTPDLEFAVNSSSVNLEFLEFNFIQVILYPQRIKKYKELRR
ncbi:MAG TPA: hypothetical protein VJ917_05575 [Saprospiraceae bacterium]|nr:hypothetical protein [Saprospiraceae bacterium]